ncbi:hypothetical protein PFMALIP_01867 [Plasmodium falciparum MaliPS096_E11]|uniref:Kinesin motor domain-containing protein n=1 Tax=Plasmodium falciparum MaliPS096_E11 TaxID=1036727 RepID=A0A024WSG4_PLAFA|nr:hypothetical protein PFMALIP_01867 [Plasmodium falciparum MaliPS096_E11]
MNEPCASQKCEHLYSSDLNNEKGQNIHYKNFDDNNCIDKDLQMYDKSITVEIESDQEYSNKRSKCDNEYSKQSTLSIDNNESENVQEYTLKTKGLCIEEKNINKEIKKIKQADDFIFYKNELMLDKSISDYEENVEDMNTLTNFDYSENVENEKEENTENKIGNVCYSNYINEKENDDLYENIKDTNVNELYNENKKMNIKDTNKGEKDKVVKNHFLNDKEDVVISNEERQQNIDVLTENYDENLENNLDMNWNKSQIKTCIRIKPSDKAECEFGKAITQIGTNKILINYEVTDEIRKSEFLIDKVFNEESTQNDVWKSICFCVDSLFHFKNTTVFAHGHTGTGKTYTMIGPDIMELIKKKKKKIRFPIRRIPPNEYYPNIHSIKFLNNNSSNNNSNNIMYDRKRSCSQPISHLLPRTIMPLVNTNSGSCKKGNDTSHNNNISYCRYNNKNNMECFNETSYTTKYENYKTFAEYKNEYKYNGKDLIEDIRYVLNSKNKGMIPRACEEIMNRLTSIKLSYDNVSKLKENTNKDNTNKENTNKDNTNKENTNKDNTNIYMKDEKKKEIFKDVKVYASYMQLYNDRIFDLLNPYNESAPYLSTQKSKYVGNNNNNNYNVSNMNCNNNNYSCGNGAFVSGLLTVEVNSCEELIELLIDGTSNRACRITKTNEMSTRSHSIYKIELRYTNNSKFDHVKSGNLLLIDLAGNEKYAASNEKLYSTEVCSINKSLSALSLCINELSKGNKNISYRNSILTRLLQDSLGGSSKTVFICTISSSMKNARETLSSLKLVSKARKIPLGNKNYNSHMYEEDIKKLKRELYFLKKFVFFQYITNKYESKKRLQNIKEFYLYNFLNSKKEEKDINDIKKREHMDSILHDGYHDEEEEEEEEEDGCKSNEKFNNDNSIPKDKNKYGIYKDKVKFDVNKIRNTFKGIEKIYSDYEFKSFSSLLAQWNVNKCSIKKAKDKLCSVNKKKKYLWFYKNGNMNKRSILNFIETHTIDYEIEEEDEEEEDDNEGINEDINEDVEEDIEEDVEEDIEEDIKEYIKEDIKEDIKEMKKELQKELKNGDKSLKVMNNENDEYDELSDEHYYYDDDPEEDSIEEAVDEEENMKNGINYHNEQTANDYSDTEVDNNMNDNKYEKESMNKKKEYYINNACKYNKCVENRKEMYIKKREGLLKGEGKNIGINNNINNENDEIANVLNKDDVNAIRDTYKNMKDEYFDLLQNDTKSLIQKKKDDHENKKEKINEDLMKSMSVGERKESSKNNKKEYDIPLSNNKYDCKLLDKKKKLINSKKIKKINDGDEIKSRTSLKEEKEKKKETNTNNSCVLNNNCHISDFTNFSSRKNSINNVGINNLVINKINNFHHIKGYTCDKMNSKKCTNDNNKIMCEGLRGDSKYPKSGNNKYYDDKHIYVDHNTYNLLDRERSVSENFSYSNLKNKTIIGKNFKDTFSYYIEFDKYNSDDHKNYDIIKNCTHGKMIRDTRKDEENNVPDSNNFSVCSERLKDWREDKKDGTQKIYVKKKVTKNQLINEIEKSWLTFEKKLENKLNLKKKYIIKEIDEGRKINDDVNNGMDNISALEENKKKLEHLKNRYGQMLRDSQKKKNNIKKEYYNDKMDMDLNESDKCNGDIHYGGYYNDNNNNNNNNNNSNNYIYSNNCYTHSGKYNYNNTHHHNDNEKDSSSKTFFYINVEKKDTDAFHLLHKVYNKSRKDEVIYDIKEEDNNINVSHNVVHNNVNTCLENYYMNRYKSDKLNQNQQTELVYGRNPYGSTKMHKMNFFYLNDNKNITLSKNVDTKKKSVEKNDYLLINENKRNYVNNLIPYNHVGSRDNGINKRNHIGDINDKYQLKEHVHYMKTNQHNHMSNRKSNIIYGNNVIPKDSHDTSVLVSPIQNSHNKTSAFICMPNYRSIRKFE